MCYKEHGSMKRLGKASLLLILGCAILMPWARAASSAEPNEVLIGVVLPLTGRAAPWGTKALKGAKFVMNEVNAGGGIKSLGGAKIKLEVLDNQSSVDVSLSQTERVFGKRPLCVMGNVDSASTMACTVLAEKYGIPHITAQSVADEISERGLQYTFQRSAKSASSARDIVDFVHWVGKKTGKPAKKVAILVENRDAGLKAGMGYRNQLKLYSEMKIVDLITYPTEQEDFTAIISLCKAKKIDLLFQMSYVFDGIRFVKQMKTLDYNPLGIVISAAGPTQPDFWKGLGEDARYIFSAQSIVPAMLELPGIKEINERYKAFAGEDLDHSSSQWLSAMGSVVHVLEEIGSTDPEKFLEAFRKVNLDFGTGYQVSPMGIAWDSSQHNKKASWVICQYLGNDKRTPVFPEKVAVADPVWPVPKWGKR